jgi:hypothetical protein
MLDELKAYMNHDIKVNVRVEDIHATDIHDVFITSVDDHGIVVSSKSRGSRPMVIPYNSLAWVQPQ